MSVPLLTRRGQSAAEVEAIAVRGQPTVLEPFPLKAINSTTAAVAANTVYIARLPRVFVATPLNWVEYHVGAAAGNVAAALMTTTSAIDTEAEALAASFTRVAHTGEVLAAGTTQFQRLSLSATYDYQPGTNLWVAFGGNNASLTVGRYSSLGAALARRADYMAKASAYSTGIPNPLATFTANGLVVYLAVG